MAALKRIVRRRLIGRLGVKIDPLSVAADRLTARRVSMGQGQPPIPYLPWLCCARPIWTRSRRSRPALTLWLWQRRRHRAARGATSADTLGPTSPGSATLMTAQWSVGSTRGG